MTPSTDNDPTTRALQTLALTKYLTGELKARENAARSVLAGAMSPGDRRVVTAANGVEVATVSLTRPSEREQLVVTDPDALYLWAKEHECAPDGVRTTIVLPDWFTSEANLRALIDRAGGELPDGITIHTSTRKPTVMVRQSAAQALAIRDYQSVAALESELLEIGGGEEA